MKNILKIELKRSIFNKWTCVSVLVGMIICLLQFYQMAKVRGMYFEAIAEDGLEKMTNICTTTPFDNWILFDQSRYNYLLLFIMPILVALPFGASFYQDVKSGYIKQIVLRISKKDYLKAKYFSTFISGGFVIVCPVLVNFLLMGLVYPFHKPYIYASQMYMESTLGIDLFFEHPFVYVAVYMMFLFITAGAMATICLLISMQISNYFSVIITPFIVSFILIFTSSIIGYTDIAPMHWLQACTTGRNFTAAIIELIIFTIPIYCIFTKSKADIL